MLQCGSEVESRHDDVRLPHHEQAAVPERKIVAYLLSFTHPDGKSKAAFFSRFGFTATRWEELANAFRRHAAENEVAVREDTLYGTSYSVDGRLHTPDGRDPTVRVVWFVEHGQTVPRLVTAFPQK